MLRLKAIADLFGTPSAVFADKQLRGVSIDSRSLVPGELFFAIRGPRCDGHDFLEAVSRLGAAGAVVDRLWAAKNARSADLPVFVVEDTTLALGQLAGVMRSKSKVTSCAVTGSCGKTTSKELLRHILSTKYKVHATQGNLNNQYGLPLTLLSMPAESDFLVAELGASKLGDVAYLAAIARPEYGLLTNVHAAHLAGFGSLDNIYDAKLELAEYLAAHKGTLLVWGDDHKLRVKAKSFGGKVLTFGRETENDYCLTEFEQRSEQALMRVNAERAIQIERFGSRHPMNCLATAALGDMLGLSMEEIEAGINHYRPVPGRWERVELGNGIIIINDAYNANPGSVAFALEQFHAQPKSGGRRIVVLGSMLELGTFSEELHREIGRALANFGFDLVLTVGEEARWIGNELKLRTSSGQIEHFKDARKAGVFLQANLRGEDLVLLKGSRSVGLEKIINDFKTGLNSQRVA